MSDSELWWNIYIIQQLHDLYILARVWRKFHLMTFCFRLHFYILYIWLDLCRCSATVYSPVVSRLYKLVCTFVVAGAMVNKDSFQKQWKSYMMLEDYQGWWIFEFDNNTFWSVFLYIHHCKTTPRCSFTFCYRRGQSVLTVWISRAPALRQPAQSLPNVRLHLFDNHFCLSVLLCSLHSCLSHGIKPKATVSQ
jgi:hypothetical protein